MKRALIGLAAAAAAVTSLATAGAASAATGQVTQVRVHGQFMSATWHSTPSATSSIDTIAVAQASELYVDQFTANTDTSGNFTGGTDTFADVTTGFSFAIDKGQLATGSVSGSGIPATTCAVDASGHDSNCSATTIDVTVDWTGQGPILREVSNGHLNFPGFSQTIHVNEKARSATAAGTFSGSTLNPSDLQIGVLGFANSGIITRCIGTTC